jgi:hypothetical protein
MFSNETLGVLLSTNLDVATSSLLDELWSQVRR